VPEAAAVALAVVGSLSIPPAIAMGHAQTVAGQNASPQDLPEFDAVSVKPNKSRDVARAMGPEPGGRFNARNVPLRDLLAVGYSIPPLFASYRIAGGPEWIDSARFDVSATSGRDVPPDQVALRVRRLLSDRFGVKAHWETRELPVYALVLTKPDGALGSRLKRSDVDCAALRAAARGGPPPAVPAGGRAVCTGRTIPGTITGVALSMDTLASSLARFAGRIVQNRTGLTGGFDYELTWTPDQPVEQIPGAPLDIDPNGPSLFTAVQEQLGLKLDAQKGAVDVLVVDHADPPSPD
jgi:uncharacterized protein (TIGR03435 family)